MKKKESNYRCQFCFSALFYVVMATMFLCGLLSCSSDETTVNEPVPDEELETVEVPITISMGSGWEIDTEETRATPPGVGMITGDGNVTIAEESGPDDGLEELENVDEVDIIVFRRKVGSSGDFQYDERNRQQRNLETTGGEYDDRFGNDEEHKKDHKVAHGRLLKVYSYEYRVVAVAYSTTATTPYKDGETYLFDRTDGDLNRFGYNDLYSRPNFSDFRAILSEGGINLKGNNEWEKRVSGSQGSWDVHPFNNILTHKITDHPQLFFGECYTEFNGKRNEVIQYSEPNEEGEEIKDISLKGILFRGMAKVEVRVKPTKYNPSLGVYQSASMICLMAKNVLTTVGLTDYDDFLKGGNPIPKDPNTTLKDGEYSVTSYKSLDNPNPEEWVVLEAYFLQCKTRLAIRACHDKSGIYLEHFRNGYLNYKDSDWENVGNGTGIISPLTHDGEFYLRRNHKYVITINDLDKFLQDYSSEKSSYNEPAK